MSNILNINSEQLVKYTNKLEQIGRRDLPIAVRGALNKTALHAKQKSLPAVFSREFIRRDKTFLRSHSSAKLESFSNLTISTMESGVGIVAGKSLAGDNLEKQEEGGSFSKRFVPMDEVREGKNRLAKQREENYFKNFKDANMGVISRSGYRTIIKTKDRVYQVTASGLAKKRRAGWARKPTKNRVAKRDNSKRGLGNQPIWRTLYKIPDSNSIKPTHFVNKSANEAAKELPAIFIKEAKKRIEKRLK